MDVYIVILHYGELKVTQACIESLLKKDRDFSKIVLINNDPKITVTEKNFSDSKRLIIINNRKNLGFAAGVNVGIKYALSKKAKSILLLNNDTQIEEPITKPLNDFLFKEKEIGIVGPAIEFVKNGRHVFDLGGDVNLLFGRTQHYEVDKITKVTPRQVTYISGCCMLIKAEVFRSIGDFDEQFFLYYEDVDFSLRAKENSFQSFIMPKIVIHHDLSRAAGKVSPLSVYYQTKSGLLFGRKYCHIVLFNRIFLFLQSIKIFLKNQRAGKSAFRALLGIPL